ncbi:28S ribosomal protein S35, mitochondrial [Aphelenchoides bicaudatus]|nr:28S ribosomal protein S35, mitochondrial [Aphelenchoides bicaudatus]
MKLLVFRRSCLRLLSTSPKEPEEFREMFLKPNRKLQTQLRIEQMTGRGDKETRSNTDIINRLAVRTPRQEEMPVDQDWPSVWPAAASFRSSVVPLPVRMGGRRNAAKRPPFKTVGNLELLKIPNFLHLTPEHIRRQCEVVKQFFTTFPKELKDDQSLISKHLPLTISYSDFVHQSNSIRDMRARVITIKIKVADLHLDDHAKDKLRRLVGNRYDQDTDTLAIVTDRCFTRKQNRDYAEYLFTVLYHECNKFEEWEKQKQRINNWKVEFEGSPLEERLQELIQISDKPNSDVPADKTIKNKPEIKEFVETWTDYRNKTETVDATRRYAESARKLLGVQNLTNDLKNNAGTTSK